MTSGTGTADGLMIPVVLQVWNKYWISDGTIKPPKSYSF